MEDLDHGVNVAIIGAGWAGMAAAVALAEAKIPVTVFEAARHLGG
ncbi:MAG: NAD(P)-binding protein, partial [Pseudomonadota bacterium]